MYYFYCPYYHQPVISVRAVTFEQLQALLGQRVILKEKNGRIIIGTLMDVVTSNGGTVKIFTGEPGQESIYVAYVPVIESVVPLFGGGGFGVPGGGFGGMGGALGGGAFGGFGV